MDNTALPAPVPSTQRLSSEGFAMPLNAQIAKALGWNVWEDPRPGESGRWFMENETALELVPDYVSMLRNLAAVPVASEGVAS